MITIIEIVWGYHLNQPDKCRDELPGPGRTPRRHLKPSPWRISRWLDHCGGYVSASGEEAFRWTEAEGMVGLGDLPGGIFNSGANGISADGSTIVGESSSASGSEAFRWTADGGIMSLGGSSTQVHGVSADGSTIVGSSMFRLGREAFRWTEAEGMIGLGFLSDDSWQSIAHGISADGSVIVGYDGNYAPGDGEAFIWDQENGMVSLQDMLSANGVDMNGWTLTKANAISADGSTIVGWGRNPDGYQEAFVATIPEPATLSLLALGALAFRRRRA